MKRLKIISLVVLSLAIVISFLLFACQSNNATEQNDEPLNVVLITLDDMGYGTTGVEGSTVPGITPYIDKLASEGMTFTRGFVMSPMCGPSRAALLTGRYPHCSGMMGHGTQPPELWEEPLVKTPSISTYLHDKGYTTGAILKLRRSKYLNTWDMEDNTLVIFLSDHGMGAPGAKNTLYHDGIRTPIIFRWPGKIEAGVLDERSIVSAIDIVPTILDAAGVPTLGEIEGKSIMDVILGKAAQAERAYAYASSNYRSNSTQEEFFPQRAIIDESFCYIFNSYLLRSDGKKAKHSGWMDVVNSSISKSEKLKQKIDYMVYRAPEELYDLKKDPGCWNNLAQNPEYADTKEEYRKNLYKEMKETADPELLVFNSVHN